MPTLITLSGGVLKLGDGPRYINQSIDPMRDMELGGSNTRDLYLLHPPLEPILLGAFSAPVATALSLALHRALEAAEEGTEVSVRALLDKIEAAR